VLTTKLRERRVSTTWVATSLQIQLVADELGLATLPLPGARIAKVIDGADQVDKKLNLIKGGGGALLKEKILLGNAREAIIVADEKKFAEKLCMGDVRVPVEVVPFARRTVSSRMEELKGDVKVRLDQRGFPVYSENGNVLIDVLFDPIKNPAKLEGEIKATPGVVEVGIFVVRPITVCKILPSGDYEPLSSKS